MLHARMHALLRTLHWICWVYHPGRAMISILRYFLDHRHGCSEYQNISVALTLGIQHGAVNMLQVQAHSTHSS
jgi:hypothetical protein